MKYNLQHQKLQKAEPAEGTISVDTGAGTDRESPEERIAELERKQKRLENQLSVLQHFSSVFAAMPKPAQIAKMLLELFDGELKAQTSVVWFKGKYADTYKPYSGIGLNKEIWSGWKLPAPNPFPHAPMLLLQPQWLEKQAILPGMEPLLGAKRELALYYIPFEYNTALTGFAVIGIHPDHPMDDEFDALAILGRQVAASLFNSNLFMDLSSQRDELKFKAIELEKANTTLTKMDHFKNEFLVITSHELRTPLTGILGFIKLVMDGSYEDEDEMLQMLQDSYSSGKYLMKLLNDILDLAKIESGQLEIHLRQISVQKCFTDIKSIVQAIPKKSDVIIKWPDNLESLPDVYADEDRFNQVLINLVTNALKFTSEGSVSIIAERDIGFINFSVIDTGIGISPEGQIYLFQKFVQADSGRTREFGGTGLGLVISRHLVEMMNGSIALHSNGEGCGTTVRFSVPIA